MSPLDTFALFVFLGLLTVSSVNGEFLIIFLYLLASSDESTHLEYTLMA